MIYTEERHHSKPYKEEYLRGFEQLIQTRQQACIAMRDQYIKDVFHDPERYRADLRAMIGWPLCQTREGIPNTDMTELAREDTHTVYRMRFEILDGLWMTGLFFKVDGRRPLAIVQHGGLGTPELISGFCGSTTNYHHMLTRIIRHGVHAFAPQLLLWDKETYALDYDRDEIDAKLKRVGSSVAAVDIYGIMRILDYFEAQDYVSSFGMAGLSYGGFYTLHTAALDTRIKSALSCAYFNTRDRFPWPSMTWFSEASRFDDAEIACLVYPRSLCLLIGDHDPLFHAEGGLWSQERLKTLCGSKYEEFVTFSAFDGVHEFCKDDRYIEQFIQGME